MIRVIYAIHAVTIEDLKMRLGNSNLLLRKSAIRFKPLTQKREIDKQTACALYYQH